MFCGWTKDISVYDGNFQRVGKVLQLCRDDDTVMVVSDKLSGSLLKILDATTC